MLERVSTELVRFFGIQLSRELDSGKFANVFRGGDQSQKTIPASLERLTTDGLIPASINIDQYQTALGFLLESGAERTIAPAMAVAFVDTAKALGISVSGLLTLSDDKTIKLLQDRAYGFLNRLRDPSSSLTRAEPVDNNLSRMFRFGDSYEQPEIAEEFPEWGGGNLVQIENPPAVITGLLVRRVAFSADSQLLAFNKTDSNRPISIYTVGDWEPLIEPNLDSVGFQITSLEFSPRDPLLAVGFYADNDKDGLRIVNTDSWQLLPNTPELEYVNSMSWSPNGDYLAIVHAPDFNTSVLSVYNRNNWSKDFELTTNIPIRPIKIRYSSDGSRLAVYGNEENGPSVARVVLYDTSTWQIVNSFQVQGGNQTYGAFGPDFSFTPDNRYLVIPGSELGAFGLWVGDTQTNQSFVVPLTTGTAYAVTISPDGAFAIVSAAEGPTGNVLSVVSTETWTEVTGQSIVGLDFIPHLRMSPNGLYIALANLSFLSPLNPIIFGPPQV